MLPKISKRVVDRLRPDPAGKEVWVWDAGDGALKGFGIRMMPSGSAAYLVQYRNVDGRTRRLVLGRVGTLAPEEARDLARDKLREATMGGDPSAARHARRKAMTITALCDWYLEDADGRVKASTLAMDKSRIERHVKPLLGARTVAGLTLGDIEKMQTDIAAGRTARARPDKGRTGRTTGGRGVASRTVGMLGTILEFARRHSIIEVNPARGVRRFPDQPRHRFLTIDELRVLGAAMREAEAEGASRTGIAAVQALALTGFRKQEILALPARWLDASAQCVRFEDTKSGAQIRPLGTAAAAFLADRQVGSSQWLFPADKGDGHFIGIAQVLADLAARAGINDVTPHTLRHSFASVAAELGFSEMTIAGLLGHAARGVTQRYSHVPDAALVAAADRVSAVIDAALAGTDAEVVPTRRRTAARRV